MLPFTAKLAGYVDSNADLDLALCAAVSDLELHCLIETLSEYLASIHWKK